MSKADREAPIAVIVENRRLVPADAWAQDELAKLPQGVRLNAYLTIAKSDPDDAHGQLLKKYMAGINELFHYLPNTGPGTPYPTANHLRKRILIDLGFCETWPTIRGELRKEAHSMARDKMSYEDLQVCFELTRSYCLIMTERIAGERFDPWERWELEHPKVT
jgi:hypothetical protein